MNTGKQIGQMVKNLHSDPKPEPLDPPFYVQVNDQLVSGLQLVRSVGEFREEHGEVVEFMVMATDWRCGDHWLHWLDEGQTAQLKVPGGYGQSKEVTAFGIGEP